MENYYYEVKPDIVIKSINKNIVSLALECRDKDGELIKEILNFQLIAGDKLRIHGMHSAIVLDTKSLTRAGIKKALTLAMAGVDVTQHNEVE